MTFQRQVFWQIGSAAFNLLDAGLNNWRKMLPKLNKSASGFPIFPRRRLDISNGIGNRYPQITLFR